jgi:hypothetical protein
MKTTLVVASVLAMALATSAAAVEISQQRIVSRDQVERAVVVRDVTMSDDGEVSGVVVNRSSNPVRDLRLAIRYDWLWRNETRPGTDDPSRAEFYTVPGEIPPGGSVRFNFRSPGPLPRRSDGYFVAVADPIEFVEIVQGGSPPGTTSGTGTGTGTAPGTGTQPPPSGGAYEPPRQPPAGTAPSMPPPIRAPEVPY